jgi:hypothetical protein
MIEASHGGKVNDSEFGRRMRGEGVISDLIAQQFKKYTQRYGIADSRWELDCSQFRRPGEQMKLF